MSFRGPSILVVMLTLVSLAPLAQELPPGTVLPAIARKTVDSTKAKVGDKLSFRLMQDIALPSGSRVRAGARLEGQIVESSPASSTSAARVLLRIDRLRIDKREVPIRLSLRALASMQDVFSAQLPTSSFDDYGTSVSDWTTIQVGGAAVYLGDATVRDGMQIVGRAPGYGIVSATLVPAPKLGCPAREGDSDREQALWVFSPWACGAYGFPELTIAHHGNTAPVGLIELTAPGTIRVRSGSGWLLRVVETPPVGASSAAE